MDVERSIQGGQETSRAIEVGMIGPIAQWCECLHGTDPLLKSLQMLATGLGAEAVVLARYGSVKGGETRAIFWDGCKDSAIVGRVERGFAHAVLGRFFDKARAGSLWFKSMIEDDLAPDLAAFHERRRLAELVVIPLQIGERTSDMLELHFAERPRAYQQAVLNVLGPVLARTWHNRARGLFTEALLRATPRTAVPEGVPILSMENPARLSRAEYRVCLLLSRGLTMDEIKGELKISDSTLRTHLSNLYAKTGSANAGELIYQLVSIRPFTGAGGRSCRVA